MDNRNNAEPHKRPSSITQEPAPANGPSSFAWAYGLVLVLALVAFGAGAYLAANHHGYAMLAAGTVSLVGILITWPIAASLSAARERAAKDYDEYTKALYERLQEISVVLTLVSEQQLLSDRAKSVAFREKDREALRRAIREEMSNGDWEAALVLAGDMENAFGYRHEANQFRDQINNARQEIIRKQIADVVAVIDRLTRAEDWTAARVEADKLLKQLPDNDQVRGLPAEIESRRQATKKRLLDSWNDAVARHDVDGSIEILKKLDTYLTPAEGESMQVAARGIFKEKLNNLRMQFSIAVQDHRWPEAIRIGDLIIRDFPNSQMAKEVKEKMDALRQRASEPEPAKV